MAHITKTVTRGLLKDLFGPGVMFKDLTPEQDRFYRAEWRRRNIEHVRTRNERTREARNARRRELLMDPDRHAKHRANQREWIKNNRHRTAPYYKRYRLKAEYGLTLEEFGAMRERQGGLCALCGRKDSGRPIWKDLCVDHDHATGKVRDLLCHQCNMVLGHARDDVKLLRRAAAYVEAHRWKAGTNGQARQTPNGARRRPAVRQVLDRVSSPLFKEGCAESLGEVEPIARTGGSDYCGARVAGSGLSLECRERGLCAVSSLVAERGAVDR